MNQQKKIIINEENNLFGLRVDKAIAILEKDSFSRSKIESFFEKKLIKVNNKPAKPSLKLKLNDILEYETFEEKYDIKFNENSTTNIEIIYQDEYLAVINKPRGLVVHPGNGHQNDTLVNILINQLDSLSSINGEYRPGIVHRIDKDTSGLLVIAKDDKTHEFLSSQLKDHTMSRKYIAIVKGIIKENSGKIIAPIGRDKSNRLKMCVDVKNGKEAITYFKVKERLKNHTVVELNLETGRTHQIRVHMAYIGYPVEGDVLYNKHYQDFSGQLLHAYAISFIHPSSNKKVEFQSEIPQYFIEAINKLK